MKFYQRHVVFPNKWWQKMKPNHLVTLEKRMLNDVYGQNDAISQIVNAVKFFKSRAFGRRKATCKAFFCRTNRRWKTQIAKSLAKELSVKLVRFDMSEYEEKHAVAKLIGAPAGYVGYEEGRTSDRRNPKKSALYSFIR